MDAASFEKAVGDSITSCALEFATKWRATFSELQRHWTSNNLSASPAAYHQETKAAEEHLTTFGEAMIEKIIPLVLAADSGIRDHIFSKAESKLKFKLNQWQTGRNRELEDRFKQIGQPGHPFRFNLNPTIEKITMKFNAEFQAVNLKERSIRSKEAEQDRKLALFQESQLMAMAESNAIAQRALDESRNSNEVAREARDIARRSQILVWFWIITTLVVGLLAKYL